MNRRKFLAYLSTTIAYTWSENSESAVALRTALAKGKSGETGGAQLLPMFPLEMVVFPGQLVLLHIFEPRYQELISDCDKQGLTFGISAVTGNRHAAYGTEMRLTRILKTYSSGNMDIALKGMRTFRLEEFVSITEKLYRGGLVHYYANDASIEIDRQNALVEQFNRFQALENSGQILSGEIPDNLSFVIGHNVKLSTIQKIQMIAMPNEIDRQKFLSKHLAEVIDKSQLVPSKGI